jgi:hypothetical protein
MKLCTVDTDKAKLRLFGDRGRPLRNLIAHSGNLDPASKMTATSSAWLWKIGLIVALSVVALPLPAREKDPIQYGMGLVITVPFPESEVTQVLQDLVQNGIIRGSKEYEKDEYITGATAVSSTRLFPEWSEGGKVFYKVRSKAVDPRNFKNTNDVGTLAVRYVVQAQDDKNTVLHINAIFVEDSRHVVHQSNGSVEGAEYKDIHDRLDALALMKAQTVDAEKEKQEQGTRKQPVPVIETAPANAPAPDSPTPAIASANTPQTPPQTLEEHVRDLRQQVERLVKAPGAPLKSAPFHTASTLQSLPAGTEVLIVISTPYWFGVETHAGQHGWMLRDQLEQLP